MSNKYEQILEKQIGNGYNIKEGFQKLILKDIEWMNPKFNDICINITVSPVNHPQMNIRKIIGGDWNIKQKNRKPTIWKVTHIFDMLGKIINYDISLEELFDISQKPPEFLKEKIVEINNSFDTVELYGYLFQGIKKHKMKQKKRLFWNVHYLFASSDKYQDSVVKSFSKWKNNSVVQKYWQFEMQPNENLSNSTFIEDTPEEEVPEPVKF